ncbi:MAG TPA: hypothetical protein VFM68_03140 [Candidatus Saccharimonadales bacterium]|nr:hypothetical protein [Candidatus Saccharimonadales bacterium]
MSKVYANDEQPTSLVTMSFRKLLMVVVIGAIAGLVTWGLTYLLDVYVYKAILCNDETAVQCASSSQYAMVTAAVIGAAVGLFGLVRLQVFRPLLVVIASVIALWGLIEVVTFMPWYLAATVSAVLYGLALAVFAWFARVRHFLLAIILVVIMIVAVRLVLNA